MQYRTMKDKTRISILGFGCMRFPQDGSKIDMIETEKEILHAIDQGINYFDTAYIYPGSEAALGTILQKNSLRDQVMIATKIPQYLVKNSDGFDKYFEEEKKRLQTDHIDFYLLHMLSDAGRLQQLRDMGLDEWIQKKKASGEIRYLGFSFHGNTETFLKLLDAYDWDFCQIQYNYLDEHSQAGRTGLMAAAQKDIPVIIMEPLRGGRLVNFLPEASKKRIEFNERHYTPAEWSFRWLWDQPQVTCVLSGMNSMEMLSENISLADKVAVNAFTQEDHAFIEQIKKDILETQKVGCTGCRYCMPCPKNVDIPGTFSCYNHMYTEKKNQARVEYLMLTAFHKESNDYSQCIECGKCEMHCPQHIEIRKELKIAGRHLMPWYMKIFRKLARIFMAK